MKRSERTKTRGYVLELFDAKNNPVELHICEEGHADQMIRAMVHSGLTVKMREAIITIPEGLRLLLTAEREMDRELQQTRPTRPTEAVEPWLVTEEPPERMVEPNTAAMRNLVNTFS